MRASHSFTTLALLAPLVVAAQPVERAAKHELVIPLRFDEGFAPSIHDLLGSVSLKFGLPLLDNLLKPITTTLLGKPKSHKKRLLGGLLGAVTGLLPGVEVNLGIGDLLDLNLDVDLNLAPVDIIDDGWDGAKTSRLINSKSDNAWFAEVSFGKPQQTLTINIDSGSADTVVFDKTCKTCQLNNHTAFDHGASSTFKRSNDTFATQYGDGTTLTGMLAADGVHMSDSLSVPSQLMALITKRQGGGSTHAWDGILGIGPDALSFVEGNVTPLSNLVKSGQLRQPLVGVLLIKSNKVSSGGGEYRWGGINRNYVQGKVIYTPVTSSYYWGCNVPGVWVKNKQMLPAKDAKRAIVDTGTTLIYTSTATARNIHATIPGSKLNTKEKAWYVPCDTSKSPNVFFEIQGHRWGVPASDIAFRDSGRKDGLCVSGIQGGSEQFTILGDVFIKNHYLVFNYGDAKNYTLSIGIANRTDIPYISA